MHDAPFFAIVRNAPARLPQDEGRSYLLHGGVIVRR